MNESQTGEASNPFLGKVLVGVDGSDGSHDAVEWTARLATATGAEVLAVHILTYDRELLRDLSLDTIRTWRRDLATSSRPAGRARCGSPASPTGALSSKMTRPPPDCSPSPTASKSTSLSSARSGAADSSDGSLAA